MIEILSSKNCHFCDKQISIMKEGFFEDEYRVLDADSDEFLEHDCRQLAATEGVPCVVIKDEGGVVRFADSGVIRANELRDMERAVKFASLGISN